MVPFLRIILKSFLIILLLLLLASFIFIFSFSHALKPDIVRPILEDLFTSSIPKDADLNTSYLMFNSLCIDKDSIDIPLREGDPSDTLNINCDKIRSSSPSSIKEILAEAMFNKIYYKEYKCVFLDCFENAFNSTFLISNHANVILSDLTYIILAVFVLSLLISLPILRANDIALVFLINGLPFFLFFTRKSIIEQVSKVLVIQRAVPLISSFLFNFSVLSVFLLGVAILILLTSTFKNILDRKKQQKLKKKRGKRSNKKGNLL